MFLDIARKNERGRALLNTNGPAELNPEPPFIGERGTT